MRKLCVVLAFSVSAFGQTGTPCSHDNGLMLSQGGHYWSCIDLKWAPVEPKSGSGKPPSQGIPQDPPKKTMCGDDPCNAIYSYDHFGADAPSHCSGCFNIQPASADPVLHPTTKEYVDQLKDRIFALEKRVKDLESLNARNNYCVLIQRSPTGDGDSQVRIPCPEVSK